MKTLEILGIDGSLKIQKYIGGAMPEEPNKFFQKAAAILIGGLLASLWGCSSPPIRFDYDARTDFLRFKTFDFYPIPETIRSEIDPKVIQRIQQAVTRKLQYKGMILNATDPDLRIAVHTESGTKFSVILWGYHYAPYSYYWQEDAYWNGGIDLARYPAGTLVLDIVRTDKNEMIWRGVVPQALPEDLDQSELDRCVNRAVEQILENFPPQRNLTG
jgi:hypothetical protein